MKWKIVIIDTSHKNIPLESDFVPFDEAYQAILVYMKPSMFGTNRYKIYLEPKKED
jgi:hypothetical protein